MLFFGLLFNNATEAQKIEWLQPLEKGFTYKNGSFKDAKGEEKKFSIKEKKWVNAKDLEPKDSLISAFLKIYTNVYPVGNVGYSVSKYGMTAVIDKNNKVILPYANDIQRIWAEKENTISVKSKNCNYVYDEKGRLLTFKQDYEAPRINSLYLSYKNNVLYDYEKRQVLSDTFQNLELIRDLKTLFVAEKNGKSGVINEKNEKIIPFDYPELTYVADSILIARKYGEYALINLKGKELMPYSILKLEARRGNIITQADGNGKEAAFNLQGKKISEAIYTMIYGTDDGLLWGQKSGSEYISMDKNGKILDFEPLEQVRSINENTFNKTAHYAKTKTGWGIQRKDGSWLVPPFSSSDEMLESGFIRILRNDIEKFNLSEVKSCERCYETAYYFNHDFKLLSPTPCKLAQFKNTKDTFTITTNKKIGLIKRSGEVLFPAEYTKIELLSDGVFFLEMNKNTQLLDKNKQVISMKDTLISVSDLDTESHYAYTKRGSGIQRKNGTWIFEPLGKKRYMYADEFFIFVEKNAFIELKNKGAIQCDTCKEGYYIFDRNAKLILKTPAQVSRIYNTKYYIASNKDKRGIIDATGKNILELNYDFIQAIDERTFYAQKGNEFGVFELR